MYTILLVDDDDSILTSLQTSIDWPSYGIETILTAKDGLEGYELFNNYNIDILITDISMPRMDGLELFRKIRESSRHTRCILLSSYGDFDYAKDAIQLGVENYLMKPVDTEELNCTIRRALDNISLHRQAMYSIFHDNILYRWITGSISSDELRERAKLINLNTYFLNYCVVLLECSPINEVDQTLRSVLHQLWKNYEVYHFLHSDGYFVIILGGHSIQQSDITNIMQKILDAQTTAASVGVVSKGIEGVHASYKCALEYLLLSHSSQQVSTALIDLAPELTEYHLKLIVDYLSDENEDANIQYLFNEITAGYHLHSREDINMFSNMLSVRLALTLEEKGLIDIEGRKSIISNTYHFQDDVVGDELLQWFSNLMSASLILIKEHLHHLSPVVLSAMDYVRKKYAEHASLQDFCNKYHANASYIGYLFKKETGVYFNDYINYVRINYSIYLLSNTKMKISEVASSSGFNNSSYFILCFKKRTGISPARFRHMIKNPTQN